MGRPLGSSTTPSRMPLPCSPQRMDVATSSRPAAAPARVIGISRRGRLGSNCRSYHAFGLLQDGRPGVAPYRPPALAGGPLLEGALDLVGPLGALRLEGEGVHPGATHLAQHRQVGADQ